MDLLSIPSILGTVLNHLPTKYVALYRLINTNWNYEACKILQNRVTITFHTEAELQYFIEIFQYLDSRSEICLRFLTFSFSSSLFTTAVEDSAFGNMRRLQNNLDKVAKLTGNQVTQLNLVIRPILLMKSGSSPYSTVMFTETLDMVYTHFPNLKKLKLLFIASVPSSIIIKDDDEILVKINRILDNHSKKSLPKLKHIQLDLEIPQEPKNQFDEDDCDQDKPIEQRLINAFIKTVLTSAVNLETIVSGNNAPPHQFLQKCLVNTFASMKSFRLQEISIRLPVTDKLHFQTLASANLEIFGDAGLSEQENLKQFLIQCRSSLQKLLLTFNKKSQQFIFYNFPMGVLMLKLTHLNLAQFEGTLDKKMLPVLKHLKLKQCHFETLAPALNNLDSFEIIDGVLDYHKDFQKSFKELTPQFFHQLNKLTITKLRFCVPLPVIFEECSKLRSLTIQKCAGISDPVLCGIRTSLISLICPVEPVEKDNLDKGFQDLVEFSKSSGQASVREAVFIGNLKDLQFLTLEGEFTDAAVLYGITHCVNLMRLNLKSDLCTWRSSHIIQQAALSHLVNANINSSQIN